MRKRNAALAIAWIIAAIFVAVPYLVGVRLAPDTVSGLLALDRIRDGSVLFIGSSLTRCAIPYDAAFATLADAQGLHLDLVRITLPTATQEDFADAIDRIGTTRASLVLIEAEMLLRQPDSRLRRTGIAGMAYSYMAQVRALWVRLGLRGTEKSENTGNRECKLLDRSASLQDVEYVATLPHEVRSDPWLPPFRSILESGRLHGKKVVVVSLGRSAGLEAKLDPGYREAFRSALRKIRDEKRIEVWVFPSERLSDADYSDGGHLNAQGRIVFTHWLIQQLAADRAGN
jgi:hypothetical protein